MKGEGGHCEDLHRKTSNRIGMLMIIPDKILHHGPVILHKYLKPNNVAINVGTVHTQFLIYFTKAIYCIFHN